MLTLSGARLIVIRYSEGAVVAWARLAAEWYGYELGRDSAQVREMEQLLREPSAHQAWGSKRAMAVGEP